MSSTYYRFCSRVISPYTGNPYGIFVAVWHLVRDKKITPDEERDYWNRRQWFEANLPVPSFYAKGNPERAITWFKVESCGTAVVQNLEFYLNLAKKYALMIDLVKTDNPGRIIYEDAYQIATVGNDAPTDMVEPQTTRQWSTA